uniref:Peptidase C1A papain C-terminal domain-containing protein n=1 Tax=Amphimedon queenslandica TaxID=400682 RepID=A0A1X7SZ67_AMPQE
MAVVRYYGAKPDEPDDNDKRKKYGGHEIPSGGTNVDLSHYVQHVYNQENLHSCTANALCAAYGMDLKKQSQTIAGGYYYFNPSRLFLYYNTRESEGSQSKDSGASIRDTVESMNGKGVCKESDWPYTVTRFNQKPPQSAYAAAVGNNLCVYERLYQDIDQFRACLKDNCPFVFGFKVYASFHNISGPKYTMQMPKAQERDNKPLGYHAVVAVGYNDTKQHIKVLNSWGSDWGDNGYFYMPYQFIENRFFCFDFWKISFASEQGKPCPKDAVQFPDIVGILGNASPPLLDMSEASGCYGLDLSLPDPFTHSNVASGTSFYQPIPLSSFDGIGASFYGGYPPPSRVNHRPRNLHRYHDQMAVVHYYGAKPDRPDYRDQRKKYEQHEIPSERTHPNVDLSGYVHHVYDQGDLGSCTANALCSAYGLDLVKQSQTTRGGYYYFDPSRLFLYYNTREREGNQSKDSGASIRDTVKSMNRKGVCKESEWPYKVWKFKEKPPQSCYDAAVGNNLCKYERLDHNIDQFRACLKDNCPFVFGFNVYASFHNISRNGYMPLPSRREQLGEPLGYHAVVAVGYDDSRRCIKVLNSWGSRWGDGGYFYMPYEFIKDSSLCFDFWKISFACERGKPRPKDAVSGSYAGYSGSSGYYPSGSGGASGYGRSSYDYQSGGYSGYRRY